jgi:hypothetical protein
VEERWWFKVKPHFPHPVRTQKLTQYKSCRLCLRVQRLGQICSQGFLDRSVSKQIRKPVCLYCVEKCTREVTDRSLDTTLPLHPLSPRMALLMMVSPSTILQLLPTAAPTHPHLLASRRNTLHQYDLVAPYDLMSTLPTFHVSKFHHCTKIPHSD